MSKFIAWFGAPPEGFVRAPGRVCLQGEHTDYNRGYALTLAMDLNAVVAFRLANGKRVRVRSMAFPDYEDNFDVGHEFTRCQVGWANYVRGVFHIIRSYGFAFDRGLDLMICGDLPHDAGLASSGAMSTAIAGTLRKALNLPLDKRSLALVAERAENDFSGRRCGIMDPLTVSLAKKRNLLLIDCHDYSVEQIQFPEALSVIVFHSCARQKLLGHEFNELRGACEKAAHMLNVNSLREVTLEHLKRRESTMNDVIYRRALHVVTENDRTLRLARAFVSGDFAHAFRLINESHDSLKNNFGNTIPEIDLLVQLCREELKGRIGARMTGGGFGGSVVAVCEKDYVRSVVRNIRRQYEDRYKISIPAYICTPSDGMRICWASPG